MAEKLPDQPKKKYPSDPKERAAMLVAEGKIGGARPGAGRPRKKRAAEFLAEKAERHADLLWQAFLDALHPDNANALRVHAAKELVQIVNKEAELQLKEDIAFEDTPKEELVAIITEGLLALSDSGVIDTRLVAIEGSAVEHESNGAG